MSTSAGAAAGRTVGIAGGGLAGLAAGCALADAGFRVILFERRPYLGGRASSYEHPGTGEVVDNCQHVLLGCCTNLIAFYERIGVADRIRWYDRLTFVEPGGRQSVLSAARLLPAPFHSVPAFLRNSALSLADKMAIARALLAIAQMPHRLPDDPSENFLGWLGRHGQTRNAIERFWKVVLVSALNEDLDRISVRYGVQVFRESFLNSAAAGLMGVPTVPLTDLYAAAGDYIRARGGEIRLRSSVERFLPSSDHVCIDTGDAQERAEYFVSALPFNLLAQALPCEPAGAALKEQLSKFELSPITGIHLWFDRQISDLDHAVLLDRTLQWMFHKSRLLGRKQEGSYVELVVSSSKELVEKSRAEIIALALAELAEFFPAARAAELLKSTVIKEVNATFSVLPSVDRIRPAQTTAWPRVFLAGDWTATGWPATMEGAVRSGFLAAEALTSTAGQPGKFLVPDLPPAGLMRLFGQR